MLIRCKEDVYSIVYNYLVIMYVPCVNIVYIIYTFKIFFNFWTITSEFKEYLFEKVFLVYIWYVSVFDINPSSITYTSNMY